MEYPSKWSDRGCYYLSSSQQGTEEWKKERIGGIGGSAISRIVGHSDFDKTSDNDYAEEMLGLKIKIFSDIAKIRMNRGTEHEDLVRKKLEKELRLLEEYKNIRINTVGIAIWKKDQRFRPSLDGIIEKLNGDIYEETDTGIEIKCPAKMYSNVKKHIDSQGTIPLDIYASHYDQMMENGVVTGKKFMIYCVYGIDDEQLAWFKIPVDYDYWQYEIYPKACKFYDLHMKDKILQNNIQVEYVNE